MKYGTEKSKIWVDKNCPFREERSDEKSVEMR